MATTYKYNDYEYVDADDEFTVDAVRKELVQYFPELANAKAEESEDDDGNKMVTFVKRASTKGAQQRHEAAEVPPMADVELFELEADVRGAKNMGQTIELDPEQVLSLIGEAWYLRRILGDPAELPDARA
jgi:PRTRC genetic system protein C